MLLHEISTVAHEEDHLILPTNWMGSGTTTTEPIASKSSLSRTFLWIYFIRSKTAAIDAITITLNRAINVTSIGWTSDVTRLSSPKRTCLYTAACKCHSRLWDHKLPVQPFLKHSSEKMLLVVVSIVTWWNKKKVWCLTCTAENILLPFHSLAGC